jgi:thiamine-phosphate pyrophosphorylase
MDKLPRGLYAITPTDRPDEDTLLEHVRQALAGGARIIQYRDKREDVMRRETALRLRALCLDFRACFIVNDDPMLALDAGADGVHLGREDASIGHARKLLGPNAVVGVSCYNDPQRVRRAEANGASYVALGAFYPSVTKPQAPRATLDALRESVASSALPVVAIGGITPHNGATLIEAGAHALAVIDGLFGTTDIEGAARDFAALFA